MNIFDIISRGLTKEAADSAPKLSPDQLSAIANQAQPSADQFRTSDVRDAIRHTRGDLDAFISKMHSSENTPSAYSGVTAQPQGEQPARSTEQARSQNTQTKQPQTQNRPAASSVKREQAKQPHVYTKNEVARSAQPPKVESSSRAPIPGRNNAGLTRDMGFMPGKSPSSTPAALSARSNPPAAPAAAAQTQQAPSSAQTKVQQQLGSDINTLSNWKLINQALNQNPAGNADQSPTPAPRPGPWARGPVNYSTAPVVSQDGLPPAQPAQDNMQFNRAGLTRDMGFMPGRRSAPVQSTQPSQEPSYNPETIPGPFLSEGFDRFQVPPAPKDSVPPLNEYASLGEGFQDWSVPVATEEAKRWGLRPGAVMQMLRDYNDVSNSR